MPINAILIAGTILALLAAAVVWYIVSASKKQHQVVEEFPTLESVVDAVKAAVVELVREDYGVGLSTAEFESSYRLKAKTNQALKECVYGVDSAKGIVKQIIYDYISAHVPEATVTKLLGLTRELESTDSIKFEILMQVYKRKYNKKALTEIIKKYNWAEPKRTSEDVMSIAQAYYVTVQEFRDLYDKENILLDIKSQMEVLATLVYEKFKGFGIVDTLREMDIDGFNMGTSGAILNLSTSAGIQGEARQNATNSVWIYYQGKYIHLRFMDFGTEDELRRIIQLLIRYKSPGPLTAKRGYIVNTMYNKSRILALRPQASEYWAVFVRKFTLSDNSPEALVAKPGVNRPDLVISLIEYLMKGQVTHSYTGRQGSGKTTLMRAAVRYIDPRFTIRVLEMAPELYLRESYQTRNILSVAETPTTTATELQDALKKSDAAVSLVGEVATDQVAARMIQFAMTGSIFTLFSHHANTPKELVLTLRNSLVNAGGFSSMITAVKNKSSRPCA